MSTRKPKPRTPAKRSFVIQDATMLQLRLEAARLNCTVQDVVSNILDKHAERLEKKTAKA
jgi:hypothetical protein